MPVNTTNGSSDPVDVAVAGDASPGDRIAAALAIEALLGTPVPPDWADPVAIEARRERLRDAAKLAAETAVEMLVAARMASAGGVSLRPDDEPVAALARAIGELHRALVRYRHDTLRQDGMVLALDAMDAAAGAGVAALVKILIEKLRYELTEAMWAAAR